jgi:hypothetical protein
MKEMIDKCTQADDEALIRELKFVVERERRNLAAVLVVLGEYGYRRLYRDEGYYSLFEYCMRVLKYDESSAYRHITAARVVRQYPHALPLVESGELTLTSILILAPVLTTENNAVMFKEARGKSRRELETIVAGKNPLPARMDYVRTLPAPPPAWGPGSSPTPDGSSIQPSGDVGAIQAPRDWQAVMPLSLERVRIGFDAAVELTKLLDRAKQVLRHKYPEGRIEDVFRDALVFFLDKKDPQRRLTLKPEALVRDAAEHANPEPRFLRDMKAGRYIPAWVKRAVWDRDGGRCAWRFEDGTLCGSKDWIEYDHVTPFAKGGRSDAPRNVRLLCRLHNEKAAVAKGVGSVISSQPFAGRSAGTGAGPS